MLDKLEHAVFLHTEKIKMPSDLREVVSISHSNRSRNEPTEHCTPNPQTLQARSLPACQLPGHILGSSPLRPLTLCPFRGLSSLTSPFTQLMLQGPNHPVGCELVIRPPGQG